MDVNATVVAEVTQGAMYHVVSDLGRYPEWLDIVARAEPTEQLQSDPGPAWIVDLRGQLGPLRRSKRLRMARTVGHFPEMVRFERFEIDGRSHSDWVLQAAVSKVGAESVELAMSLHYGGTMWVPLLDRLLGEEINKSSGRLVALLEREQ